MLSSYRGNSGATSPQGSNKPIQVTPVSGSTFDIAIGDTDVLNGVQNRLLTTDATGKLAQLAAVAGAGISIGIAGGNITITNTSPATGGITVGAAVTGGGANRVLFEDAAQNVAADVDMQFNGTQLQLATQGITGGVLIGGDTQLYRDAANTLRTPNNLTIDTVLAVNGISNLNAGVSISTTSTVIGALDSTNASGGYLEFRRSTAPKYYFGSALAIGNAGAPTNNDLGIFAGANIYLDAGSTFFITTGTVQLSAAIQIGGNRGLQLINQTDQAAAQISTLTNSPVAGNPAFWVPCVVNGSNRSFPVW